MLGFHWRSSAPYRVLVGGVVVAAMALPAMASDQAVTFGERVAVPQLPCSLGDRPETDLQGRVPPADLLTGRAALGYSCNLEKMGQLLIPGFAGLDSYKDCAYMSRQAVVGGVQVLDVSDPRNPVPTDNLMTPAMLDPWESMRVNARRGLLVANSGVNNFLDIYDVSQDCRHPRLLSSTDMSPAKGHEGWFSPDGNTYYMSALGPDGAATLFPIDISDPAQPRQLSSWAFQSQTHGGATTEDGARSYVCQQELPPKDALLVVDTSEVAERKTAPQPRVVAQAPLGDNRFCQGVYRVTYNGRPHLIQYGESSGGADCSRSADNWANFGYPRIYDLADETQPKLVSTALLEVHLPEHCPEVTGEGAVNALGYSVHHCSPDRLYNPTILACSWFHAGLRVLDIRDPLNPVEIGYYNPGIHPVLGTNARPVVRAERGEIWFTDDAAGFVVLRFKGGIWPFRGSDPCPEYDDYYFTQYNPTSTCRTANFDGIGKPAPSAPRFRVVSK